MKAWPRPATDGLILGTDEVILSRALRIILCAQQLMEYFSRYLPRILEKWIRYDFIPIQFLELKIEALNESTLDK